MGKRGLFGDWNQLAEQLNAEGFEQRVREVGRKANTRIGLQGVAEIRRSIRAGEYEPNSAATIALKGSSKPLVDRGDLQRAITFEVQQGRDNRGRFNSKGGSVTIGVNRRSPKANIAEALHEGFTIDLRKHPQVRKAVMAKLREKGFQATSSSGGQGSADVWVVPPRPFIEQPLTSDKFLAFVRSTLQQAFAEALEAAA